MIAPALALAGLALIDGACSGFRSSLGRTGLVRHRSADLRAAKVGVAVVALLLLPASAVALWHYTDAAEAGNTYAAAAAAMLWVLGPYAAATSLALAAYGLLGWRQRYLAIALVLGPFTLIRPLVAASAAAVAGFAAHEFWTWVIIALSVIAVLAVEPLLDRQAQGSQPSETH